MIFFCKCYIFVCGDRIVLSMVELLQILLFIVELFQLDIYFILSGQINLIRSHHLLIISILN